MTLFGIVRYVKRHCSEDQRPQKVRAPPAGAQRRAGVACFPLNAYRVSQRTLMAQLAEACAALHAAHAAAIAALEEANRVLPPPATPVPPTPRLRVGRAHGSDCTSSAAHLPFFVHGTAEASPLTFETEALEVAFLNGHRGKHSWDEDTETPRAIVSEKRSYALLNCDVVYLELLRSRRVRATAAAAPMTAQALGSRLACMKRDHMNA